MAKHAAETAPAWLTLERRGKLYRITLAAGAVLVFYGILTEESLAVWAGLASTLLGNATATAYTPARAARDA